VATFYEIASNFIKQFEGFTSKAMWDVNAWRIGHGSDTLTLPDGTYRKVLQTDVTTREMAGKDLERRIKNDFEPKVRKQIGEPYYSNLPPNARISLISLAYNYGSITKPKIIQVARTGDVNALGNAIIEETKNDNLGKPYYNALRKRREIEGNFAKTFLQVAEDKVKGGIKYAKSNPITTIVMTTVVVVASYVLYKLVLKNKIK
jgi:GH24 family phage-related lysozyme (muramidase)